MYLGGIISALLTGQMVQADTITAEPAKLVLQNQTENAGQLTVGLEGGQAKLRFATGGRIFQSVKARIWTLEDYSDLVEVPLSIDESGQFVAVFQGEMFIGSKKYFVDIEAIDQTGAVYELKDYSFDWQVDSSTTSQLQTTTTSQMTTGEPTSAATTTSETPIQETSSFEAVQEVAKGNLKIQPNVAAGTIDITVYNLSNTSGIRTVKLPVWTEENGQDDLFWYVANRQADGTYKVKIDKKYHKNEMGLYNIHLYYEDNSGHLIGVTSSTATLSASGKLSIQNVNHSAGTFDVIIQQVASPVTIKAVKVPVWTTEGGQDDIQWYTATRRADGTYKVSIDKKNHKNGSGEYNIHLYYEFQNAPTQGIATAQTTLTLPTTGRLSIANQNVSKGSFDVIVSNVKSSQSIKSVKIPVWTEAGGQDDIRWYVANRQADGTYKTTVQTSNHKNGLGIYQVHLYYEYSNGQIEGIATTQTSLSNQGSIKVSNLNQKAGSFDLIISNVSAITSIKSVKVPVWTEAGGQDDIRWYTATKQADGTYQVNIQKSNHKNGLGVYQAHQIGRAHV